MAVEHGAKDAFIFEILLTQALACSETWFRLTRTVWLCDTMTAPDAAYIPEEASKCTHTHVKSKGATGLPAT